MTIIKYQKSPKGDRRNHKALALANKIQISNSKIQSADAEMEEGLWGSPYLGVVDSILELICYLFIGVWDFLTGKSNNPPFYRVMGEK